MRLIGKLVTVVVLLGLLGLAGIIGFAKLNAPAGQSRPSVLVTIPPGTPFTEVANILEQQHLLTHGWFFSLLGRVQQVDRKIIPGEYQVHAGLRTTELLAKLVKGDLYQHSVTIPEGYTVNQIAMVLDQKGLAKKSDVLRLSRDKSFILSVDVQAPTLEGYLFPDTYRFAKFTPPESILRTFVNRFHEVVTPELRAQGRSMGMNLQEVLTLASVIEKETGLARERPIVSGVFHNRLRQNIPLQSDPTVIYALSDSFDGNIRKVDLSIDSPYNTYRVRGLPPGPIANPGLAAIQAAIHPTPSNFVYFVSRNDGSHVFSATLAEHNKAVDKYQRRKKGKSSS